VDQRGGSAICPVCFWQNDGQLREVRGSQNSVNFSMSLIDRILGRPLASYEADGQRIGSAAGVPTFGLDALSSAGYGPEAALTILLPLGGSGIDVHSSAHFGIVILLGIVYLSYRQSIAACPNGGGSCTGNSDQKA
jgi:hypothetical protein